MPPPAIVEEVEEEEWLMTYADAITLLMAFFVMLVSFSKIDIPLYEEVMAGIKDEIGRGETVSTTTVLAQELESAVFEMQAEQVVDVQKTNKGLSIEMSSGAFFIPGTAKLRPEAAPILDSMAVTFAKEKFKYFFIVVNGHTDDDPIHTVQFPSNWELSAGRAASVTNYFISIGLHNYRQTVVGHAATRPKFPNRTAKGDPIPENMARNRRVVIDLNVMDRTEKGDFADILLEERLAEEERKRLAEEQRARDEAQEQADESEKNESETDSNQ